MSAYVLKYYADFLNSKNLQKKGEANKNVIFCVGRNNFIDSNVFVCTLHLDSFFIYLFIFVSVHDEFIALNVAWDFKLILFSLKLKTAERDYDWNTKQFQRKRYFALIYLGFIYFAFNMWISHVIINIMLGSRRLQKWKP